MQAILTKYLPATNCKGSRIKATCDRGSITVSYPHELSGEAVHVYAADKLIERFLEEDREKYGSKDSSNPWATKRVCGGLPDGTFAHVFIS